MEKRTKLYLFLFVLVISSTARSQNVSPGLTVVVPPSPNASALGKYGEIPVSAYTGVPNINIPIYSIKGRELELPIELNYHAGGVRVEEIASWVGAGWSLNAGGVITRETRGQPDDEPSGYFNSYSSITTLAKKYLNNLTPASSNMLHAGNAQNSDLGTLDAMRGGTTDGEPDVFYFNFGKYSGKFIMNESGQFVASPLQALKVEYATSNLNSGRLARWILTTPDGVKYVFGLSLDGTRQAMEHNSNGTAWSINTTAWYLLEVYSPHNDVITLNYTNVGYTYRSRSGEVLNQIVGATAGGPGGLPAKDNMIVTNNMTVPRLTSMSSATATVSFTSTTARNDLPGETALDAISIYGAADPATPLKKWQFFYDYYTNRLTLDSISERSATGVASGNGYTFAYAGPLPDQNPDHTSINSQDLWGYYNGAINSVLPQGITVNSSQFGNVTVFGADRHSDGNYMQMGALTRINYPTGGYSTFDYEANTVYTNPVSSNIPTAGTPHMAGFSFQYNQTISQTFSVAYPDPNTGKAAVTGILHSMVNSCPYDPYGYNQCYTATIEGVNGTSYPLQSLKEGSLSFGLLPGTYKITAQGAGLSGQSGNNFYFYLYWTEYPPPPPSNPNNLQNVAVGGLRIKRITDFDGVATHVTKYLYNKFGDTASSAVLVNQPYQYANIFEGLQMTCNGNEWALGQTDYVQVRSYPLIPLMATQGSPVGYANVTKLDGENGENGKEEYTFTTANDYPDELYTYRPFPAACSFDWRRGQLLKSTTYKNTGGSFSPVKAISSHYTTAVKQTTGYGLRVEVDQTTTTSAAGSCTPVAASAQEYYAAGYRTISEFIYKDADTVRVYDQANPSAFMQTISNYKYDTSQGHYLIHQITSTNSKGQPIETDFYHPQDLTLSGTAETARQSLIANFMLSPVLDIKKSINSIQTEETKNNYKVFSNGMPLFESIELKDGPGASEKRVEFLRYDNYGHIAQQHKITDVLNTYIYNYNKSYPIASVLNADSGNVAYTGFEGDGTGNWTMPDTTHNRSNYFTGSQSYTLVTGKTISATVGAGPAYIVSYWSRGGALTVKSNGSTIAVSLTGATKRGWTYYEHLLPTTTTSVSITATSAVIDELRLFPSVAQMTTYTYVPAIGMTSTCTPDNKITYYEYDAYARLVRMRDIDSNILKQYDYQYQQQAAYSNVQMGAYFSKSCGPGYITSPIWFTVPARKYYSSISQHYVDSLATADLNTNGQANANAIGVCTPVYYNVQQSGSFTKDNCGCLAGSTVTYVIPAGIYSSTISQHYVDSIALAMVNRDGQQFADSTGTCSTPTNYNISGTNTLTILVQMSWTNVCNNTTYNFNMAAGSNTLNYGPIPQGTYQVTVQGSSTPHTFIVNGNSQTGQFATFNNIVVNGTASVRCIN